MKYRALLICLALAAATPSFPETPTIHCPADPPRVRRLQLQERWRIDADDAESPLLGYSNPSQVFAHDGRVYLLDSQLCHVLVYSDDGEYLTTIMREGDGPGEIRNPGRMFLCSDGRIAVRHGYPTMLEFVDLDGTPRGRWRLQANAWTNRIQETPLGWFSVYRESKHSDDLGTFVSIFHVAYHDDEGRRTREFHSERRESHHMQGGRTDEAAEHNPWSTAVAVDDGQVVFASVRDEYKLEWHNLDGEVTRVVTREFAAHRRSQAELDELKYKGYSIVNGDLRFKDRRLCANDPVIGTIKPLPDGRLRVHTSVFEKDLPQGMVCRYEVHASTGELLERVEIHDPTADYDVTYDVIALLDDGRAMVLRNQRPAFRTAIDASRHPRVLEKLPPIPDDREDVAFTPIMCDLVPYTGTVDSMVPARK